MDITWLTFIKKLLQLIITPKNKWLLGTLSAILLFTPQQHLAQLGLAHIAHNHKTTAGIIFTICTLSLTINSIYRLIHILTEKSRQRTTATRTHSALQTLTDEQRKTLSPLTTKRLTCGLLPCDEESTQRLVDTGILIPTGTRFLSTSGTVQHLREYTLSPIARQHFYGKD